MRHYVTAVFFAWGAAQWLGYPARRCELHPGFLKAKRFETLIVKSITVLSTLNPGFFSELAPLKLTLDFESKRFQTLIVKRINGAVNLNPVFFL